MTNGKTDSVVKQAIAILRHGGVIVYPTETVYGIGCDPFDAAACDRVRAIKGRGDDKPFLLLAADAAQVERSTGPLTGAAALLAGTFWPGPLTLVLRVREDFPGWLKGHSGGVAFRVTPHPLAAALAVGFGAPIVSTSANHSGHPPAVSYREAIDQFAGTVDIVLDTPAIMQGIASTIVDVTGAEPVIIREGGISRDAIEGTLNR